MKLSTVILLAILCFTFICFMYYLHFGAGMISVLVAFSWVMCSGREDKEANKTNY